MWDVPLFSLAWSFCLFLSLSLCVQLLFACSEIASSENNIALPLKRHSNFIMCVSIIVVVAAAIFSGSNFGL